MKNKMVWMMLLCCLLPLLLLWLAPLLGIRINSSIFPILCVVIMAVCMLNMGKGGGCCGGGHKHENEDEDKEKKEGQHGCH